MPAAFRCRAIRITDFAGGIHGENLAHHGGLLRVDLAKTGFVLAGIVQLPHTVAIYPPAGRLAGADIADLAATGALARLLKLHRVHRAVEADVDLTDLALHQRADPNVMESGDAVDIGDVLQRPAQPIEALCQDDIASACFDKCQQLIDARPCADEGAGNGAILEMVMDVLARPDALAAGLVLILDRPVVLQVGGIAGVYGDNCHGGAGWLILLDSFRCSPASMPSSAEINQPSVIY